MFNVRRVRYDAAKKAASGGKKISSPPGFHTIPIGPSYKPSGGIQKVQTVSVTVSVAPKDLLRSCSAMQGGLTPTMIFFMVGITLKPLLTVGSSLKTWCLCFLLTAPQLYRNKASDCWMSIWVVFDHDTRHPLQEEIRLARPHLFLVRTNPKIPSPSSTRVFTTYRHCRKKDFPFGIRHAMFRLNHTPSLHWNCRWSLEWSILVDWLVTTVKSGVDCTVHSKDVITRRSHYYPALLKPVNYQVDGCDHDDVDASDVQSTSSETYQKIYAICLASPMITSTTTTS